MYQDMQVSPLLYLRSSKRSFEISSGQAFFTTKGTNGHKTFVFPLWPWWFKMFIP